MSLLAPADRAEAVALEAVLRVAWRRARPDPLAFAARCGYPHLDPWQADLLTSRRHQVILNCSRQSGKSTTSALLALHEALHRPSAPVLLLAPSLRQSRELFLKVKEAARTATIGIADESAERVILEGGGRVVCLPGHEATIRGFSGVGLLVVDEASRVSDDLYYAVRPMLAVSGGRIVLLSTPFGRRGFFFKEWDEGQGWHRVAITAEQCPRIPAEWLKEERAAIGEWWYRQEYGCAFVDTLDQVFRYEDVAAAYDDDVEPLDLPVFRSA
ncbi:MAG TPA: terminase family protein [Acidimicrobiales bacterium]|nr:terminase family protein [Acidimicrobiales bacterium]